MIQKRQSMVFSPFMAIYDLVVPKDNLLRKINELVDFSFVYDELNKTVEIAIDKEIIKSKSIIVDATHTKARYNHQIPREVLMDRSKKLRKAVYQIYQTMKVKLPARTATDVLEDEITYTQELIEKVEDLTSYPKVKERLNHLKEIIADDIEHLQNSKDRDAKVGHKTADSSFFGYKTHIAMSEERIITASVITTGEKNDGKQLQTLIEKSMAAGMEIETVIG